VVRGESAACAAYANAISVKKKREHAQEAKIAVMPNPTTSITRSWHRKTAENRNPAWDAAVETVALEAVTGADSSPRTLRIRVKF
jgi:hypothetical protein